MPKRHPPPTHHTSHISTWITHTISLQRHSIRPIRASWWALHHLPLDITSCIHRLKRNFPLLSPSIFGRQWIALITRMIDSIKTCNELKRLSEKVCEIKRMTPGHLLGGLEKFLWRSGREVLGGMGEVEVVDEAFYTLLLEHVVLKRRVLGEGKLSVNEVVFLVLVQQLEILMRVGVALRMFYPEFENHTGQGGECEVRVEDQARQLGLLKKVAEDIERYERDLEAIQRELKPLMERIHRIPYQDSPFWAPSKSKPKPVSGFSNAKQSKGKKSIIAQTATPKSVAKSRISGITSAVSAPGYKWKYSYSEQLNSGFADRHQTKVREGRESGAKNVAAVGRTGRGDAEVPLDMVDAAMGAASGAATGAALGAVMAKNREIEEEEDEQPLAMIVEGDYESETDETVSEASSPSASSESDWEEDSERPWTDQFSGDEHESVVSLAPIQQRRMGADSSGSVSSRSRLEYGTWRATSSCFGHEEGGDMRALFREEGDSSDGSDGSDGSSRFDSGGYEEDGSDGSRFDSEGYPRSPWVGRDGMVEGSESERQESTRS